MCRDRQTNEIERVPASEEPDTGWGRSTPEEEDTSPGASTRRRSGPERDGERASRGAFPFGAADASPSEAARQLGSRVLDEELRAFDQVFGRAPWVVPARGDIERAAARAVDDALRSFEAKSGDDLEGVARHRIRAELFKQEKALAPGALTRPRQAIASRTRLAVAQMLEQAEEHGTGYTDDELSAALGLSPYDLALADIDLAQIKFGAERYARNRRVHDQDPRELRFRLTQRHSARIYRRVSWRQREDIVNAGHLAFDNALRGFNPDQDGPFEAYAQKAVWHAMLAEANGSLPAAVQRTLRAIAAAERTLQRQGERLHPEAIARRMAVAALRKKLERDPHESEIARETPAQLKRLEEAQGARALLMAHGEDSFTDSTDGLATSASDPMSAQYGTTWRALQPAGSGTSRARDREVIERGVSGPRESRLSQKDVGRLKERMAGLSPGLVELCMWLEGTWDHLARTSQRRPTMADLSAALRISTETLARVLALSPAIAQPRLSMAGLLAGRSIPPLVPADSETRPERSEPDDLRLPDEIREAYYDQQLDRSYLDWQLLNGPEPATFAATAAATIQARVTKAVEAVRGSKPSAQDKVIALAMAEHSVESLVGMALDRLRQPQADSHADTEPAFVKLLCDAIGNTTRQRVKRAIDRLADQTIAKIVPAGVHERGLLASRYRNGQHRVDLAPEDVATFRDLYRHLRSGLARNDLLHRILSDGAIDVLDTRYRRAKQIAVDQLSVHGWTANRCLALEFEKMQDIVAVVSALGSPHQKRLELPHAVLPMQLTAARQFFCDDSSAADVAARLGTSPDAAALMLWDVVETLRWLFDHSRVGPRPDGTVADATCRYLNFGRQPLASAETRTELATVCAGPCGTAAGAPRLTPASADALCSILGFTRGRS